MLIVSTCVLTFLASIWVCYCIIVILSITKLIPLMIKHAVWNDFVTHIKPGKFMIRLAYRRTVFFTCAFESWPFSKRNWFSILEIPNVDAPNMEWPRHHITCYELSVSVTATVWLVLTWSERAIYKKFTWNNEISDA